MILIDTGPLVALCDPRDSRHAVAVRHLKRVGRDRLGTCEAVLLESCFHLPHLFQRQRLRAMLDRWNVMSITGPDGRGFRNDIFEWLMAFAEHEPDWTDACIAVLCGRDTSLKVWTYDSEFWTTWRRLDGTAIPMAIR